MNKRLALLLFLLLVLGGGLGIGGFARPDAWFAQLHQPSFNPPGWLFAPVWTALYILIAIAGWRVWRQRAGGWPARLWWGQLGLNFLWPIAFFKAHQITLSVIIILALLAAIIGFITTAWRQNRGAAWLFTPYAAWVGFASVLNIAILALN
jgi:tryptophan-rich sensory protein